MSKGFERKNLPNGMANAKYIDLLDEDKPLAGQKWMCASFVSPENVIKQKSIFFFEEFLKYYDFSKSTKKFTQFLNFMSHKHNLNFNILMNDFQEFVQTEKEKLLEESLDDEYKNFLDENEERLQTEFNQQNEFQTAVRGLKIRGCFPTQSEAELRCKLLRDVDPNHNIYVAPVGVWVPWEPEAYKTGRVEYMEEELNQLMHEKAKNERLEKDNFDKRVTESKQKAINENIKIAEQTGNKLTQNIDDEGNLVGVDGTSSSIENKFGTGDNVSSADIRKELFEGEDIRTKENDKKNKNNK
uniref:Uncharacterized protein n=1 Tax=viral metagenome TaxID=1070528 RepID=A0A6C0KDH6_9ZZZZ